MACKQLAPYPTRVGYVKLWDAGASRHARAATPRMTHKARTGSVVVERSRNQLYSYSIYPME